MTATWEWLKAWRNRQDNAFEQPDLPDPDCESSPVVFPDNSTRVKFVFEASLHEIVQILSSVEKGATLSYPETWHNVWWLFVRNLECQVAICDEVAQCLTDENPAVVEALAAALQSNPTLLMALNAANAANGGSTPGAPISEEQANQSFLPDNVLDGETCNLDALWGACLYLVQSANRAITDVFEQLESASNTIEAMAIAAETIPAAGNYVSAAAEFADQLAENIAEAYAAAYTETYEEQLACMLFCIARETCDLNLAIVLDELGARLDFTETLTDFGVLMTTVGAGTWSGDSVADVAFWTFFGALRFGQEFGGTIGIRPLTVLMGIGADQLASDNWASLCACGEQWSMDFNFTTTDGGFVPYVNGGEDRALWTSGSGWGRAGTASTSQSAIIQIMISGLSSFNLTGATIYCSENPTFGYQLRLPDVAGADYSSGVAGAGLAQFTFVPNADSTGIWISVSDNDGEDMTGFITRLTLLGDGPSPF